MRPRIKIFSMKIESRVILFNVILLLVFNISTANSRPPKSPLPSPSEDVVFYHCDAIGTPLAMTDNEGGVVWRGQSLPFGEEFYGEGSRDTELKYIGKPYNQQLGLYDFGARYYDPNTGRFTGVDPVNGNPENPQSLNSYAYALNNPYKYFDPNGKEVIDNNYKVDISTTNVNVKKTDSLGLEYISWKNLRDKAWEKIQDKLLPACFKDFQKVANDSKKAKDFLDKIVKDPESGSDRKVYDRFIEDNLDAKPGEPTRSGSPAILAIQEAVKSPYWKDFKDSLKEVAKDIFNPAWSRVKSSLPSWEDMNE